MKITISGDLGSGKSTIGKALAQAWNYNFYSTGDIFRKLSSERGLDILQANKQSEEDRSLDDAVDDLSKKIGENENNFIFDSRLAWHFIPDCISVYLYCDIDIAAGRIFHADRGDEQTDTLKDMIASNKERRASELKRYKELYNVNLIDMTNYDIVLDTSNNTIEELTQWLSTAINKGRRGVYISRQTLEKASDFDILAHSTLLNARYTQQGWQVNKNQLKELQMNRPLIQVGIT